MAVVEQHSPSSVVEVGAVAQVQTEETAEDIAHLGAELNIAYSTICTLQANIYTCRTNHSI